MSLIFRPRPFSLVGEMMRDMARMERQFVPFVDRIDNSAASEIVNNEEKFAVNLNVSQFKPEQLKINLDGRKLTIQGEQEEKTEHGFSKTSFSRVILLPEDVDVAAVASNLTPDGTLSIEAKKKEAIQGRAIPIQHAAVEHKPTE
ncbi:unnamed protein product [Caenorhabditis sp. 36 PRJEB53466]|nr:unnamed protein product [Caenorhabditis sp. 36 PRJEB53466]